jgi:myxalamid-type polyketide synthase MxaE and MxaD
VRSGAEVIGIDEVQPTLFAIQTALAAWWRACGVTPDVVVGHSMGEVAAAHVAGALDLDDAARVICHRSRLLLTLQGRGAMAVVELSRERAEEALRGREAELSIAAENSSSSVVIAGDPGALEAVLNGLRARDVFCRTVKVDVASHSPQTEAILADLRGALAGLTPRACSIPFYSTVTGGACEGTELDANYWARNVRQPVLFSSVVSRLAADGYGLFLELSPHPILVPFVEQAARPKPVRAVGALRRNEPEPEALRASLGAAYCAGVDVAWASLYPQGGRCLPLPTYAWQRESHWTSAAPRRPSAARRGTHPLLGEHWAAAGGAGVHLWQQELEPTSAPFIGEHRLQGEAVVPAAAFLEMALAAAAKTFGPVPCAVERLRFEQMLVLREGEPRQVQALATEAAGAFAFQVASRPAAAREGDAWTVHVRATLRAAAMPPPASTEPFEARRERCAEHLPATAFYKAVARQGVAYGPSLQAVRDLWRGPGEAVAKLDVPAGDQGPYRLSPALLDGALQTLLAALSVGDEASAVPTEIARVEFAGRPTAAGAPWAHARAERDGGVVELLDDDGRPLARLEGVRVRWAALHRARSLYYVTRWAPAPAPAARADRPARHYLVLGDAAGETEGLRRSLASGGATVTTALVAPEYRRVEPGLFAFDLERPEHLRRLLQEAAPAATDLIVSFSPGPNASARLEGALRALQAAAEMPLAPRLWLVTRRAQAAGGEVAPDDAPLWGLAECARNELPALRCTTVDVDDAALPHALADELRADAPEPRIALRGRARSVARWSPWVPATHAAVPALRADAAYLVTGGLTGLGLHVAGWLARHGAKHLVLAARGEPSPTTLAALDRFEQSGTRVLTVRADVTRPEQVEALFERARQSLPPLRGAFHCAAAFAYRLLPELSPAELRAVLAPKVEGARHLHEASRGLELDCFVLFSSVSTQLGFPGAAAYAAANAYLGALAHHRRQLGLPATCVDWGVWAGVGGAGSDAMRRHVERLTWQGVGSLTPEQGEQALTIALGQAPAQFAATPFDPTRWREAQPTAASDPLFDDLAPSTSPAPAASLREALRGAESDARRHDLLVQRLRQLVAGVLRAAPESVRPEAPLGTLGFDSLMALELRNRLEASVGLQLSPTLIWTYPTLSALATFLHEQLVPALAPAAPPATALAPPRAAAATPPRPIVGLSDDEAEALLLERLTSLETPKPRV